MAISHTTAIWALMILSTLTITVAGKSTAKSPAPSPATAVGADCMTLIYNMSDCLTYVEKGSNSTKPDKGCCPELAGMLDNRPICLCKLIGKKNDFPVELDLNRALKLPSVCGLQTPPLSLCSTVGSPVGSPTSSEGPSSSSSGGLAPTAGKNGASRAKGNNNVACVVAGLAMAYASLLTMI